MNKRERTARLIDAVGGGICPIHGEFIGEGKYGLRACPYCDIEEYFKLRAKKGDKDGHVQA